VSQGHRRRSRDVALVVVPVLAAAFAGCGGNNDSAYCVDKNDRIVENRSCDSANNGGFFWYYGAGGSRFTPGTRLTGGDRVVSTDIATNARRGGFGSGSSSRSGGVGRSVAHSGGG
jgi:hypothetical protein